MLITHTEMLECVKREINMRKKVYPRWVSAGKMKPETANREIAVMEKVLETLEKQNNDNSDGWISFQLIRGK